MGAPRDELRVLRCPTLNSTASKLRLETDHCHCWMEVQEQDTLKTYVVRILLNVSRLFTKQYPKINVPGSLSDMSAIDGGVE